MTTFAHVAYPSQHPDVARAERIWTEIFDAVALVATAVRHASTGLQLWLKHAAAKRRQAAEDAKLWQVALNDERVMADLSRAMSSAAVVRNLKTYF